MEFGAIMILSNREEEILKLAILGMGDKEIALKLAISYRTVNTHMTRIYIKNQVKNRAEACAMYLKSVVFANTAFI